MTIPDEKYRLRVKGWPRGWRQYKTRTRLILIGPGKNGRFPMQWEYVLKFYPSMKDGLTLDAFVDMQKCALISASASYTRLMMKLGKLKAD